MQVQSLFDIGLIWPIMSLMWLFQNQQSVHEMSPQDGEASLRIWEISFEKEAASRPEYSRHLVVVVADCGLV